MVTTRQLVYYILDLLKLNSDDATFTEEHIMFTLSKYRALILEQQSTKNISKVLNTSNYQTICLDLEQQDSFEEDICGSNTYLRSIQEVPNMLNIGSPQVYPLDYYKGDMMTFINRNRMRFVGHNKWLKNIIYCSIGADNHLWITCSNPDFLELQRAKMFGIFSDFESASNLTCDYNGVHCDLLDVEFPLEGSLIPSVIDMVMKELSGPSWRPKDDNNNAEDDLAKLAAYIARNAKSNMQKQIES